MIKKTLPNEMDRVEHINQPGWDHAGSTIAVPKDYCGPLAS